MSVLPAGRTQPRPNWDEYFLKLAMLASERSTCPRMHCGCVIVKNNHVISTGYNGSIAGQPHCEDVGCLVENDHCIRTNHAEINALVQAVNYGSNIEGATVYVTNMSCTTCAKALIAAGIKRIAVFTDFHDTKATQFYTEAGVKIDKLPMPLNIIDYNLVSFTSAIKTEKSN
ncbi:cytidine/deoxycytidylate deaminase family protein [Patescibacteria group bacterium]|nr:cytidine/deoxycytidylate deaminase family protein [Patescibacteria group bacterium]